MEYSYKKDWWETKDHKEIKISDMETSHIENTIKFLKKHHNFYDEEYETFLKENEYMKNIAKDFEQLQQENKQLKMINKEYERLGKENGRGFKITSVKQYNIDELIRCKDNWNKLKEYIDIKLYNTEYLQKICNCRIDDTNHILLDAIRERMLELEKGSVSNVKD